MKCPIPRLAALPLLACALPSHAIELNKDFTLDVRVTALSDYRVGGFSLTQGDPALWLDTTLVHSSGLFAGVFNTNVNFGTRARRESDYYAGITRALAPNVVATVLRIEYEYPHDSQFNYGEWIGTLTAYGATLGVKYATDIKPFGDDRMITWVGYALPLPYESLLDVRYGYNDNKDDIYAAGDGSRRSTYRDWQVGLNKRAFGLEWRAAYIDTDLSRHECASVFGYNDVCSATVVWSVSKKF
ncbi:TorF family putative porin [Pseudomonas sp. RIT-PI-S]|uniref:TorF family putative porin n=1 Tax=Pseudomonas sp. RIT-PI-S TaxID=3035295 RepID=UPI0021D8E81E|nr:TorF family putative porin [Pseudomonas sp. RIT-PI-S]